MALLDGLGGSIIARLPKPPDVTTGGNGIAGFFSGLTSGYTSGLDYGKQKKEYNKAKDTLGQMAGHELSNKDAKAIGLVKPSLTQAFAKGYLSAPAARAAAEDPLYNVKRKLNEQTVQMNDLTIQNKLDSRQAAINGLAHLQEFSSILEDRLKNGTANTPESQSEIFGYLGKNPDVATLPQFQDLMKEFGLGRKFQQEAADAKARADAAAKAAEQGMVPNQRTIQTPGVGTETFQKEQKPLPGMIPKQQTIDGTRYVNPNAAPTYAPTDTMKNLQALQSARVSGDEEAAKVLEEKLGISGITGVKKLQYTAELKAILSNPLLFNDVKREEALRKLNQKYGVEGVGVTLPTISTKEEYDKLDSGTKFFGSDGKMYLKP